MCTIDLEANSWFNYAPFNIGIANLWSSSTRSDFTTSAYFTQSGRIINAFGKGGNLQYIFIRKHF